MLGTLQYMAPEQIEGHPADARTDIFAFGALLYEMLTGRRAFDPSTRSARSGHAIRPWMAVERGAVGAADLHAITWQEPV